MPEMPPGDLTPLLRAWSAGDESALEKLTPVVYRELHRLAGRYMGLEGPGHTLQATALVNEAYVRLIDWKNVQWQNRAHFFGVSAQLMRKILVDYARSRRYAKRGGGARPMAFDEAEAAGGKSFPHINPLSAPDDRMGILLEIDIALERLAAADPQLARVVELRYFGGFSVEETAEALNVAPITVIRHWNFAKAWLLRELDMERRVEPERLHQIQAIYSDAAALPPAQRRAFLDEVCCGDTTLRTEVESLLACASEDTTWLDKPAIQFAAESLAEEGGGLLVGLTLGRYQLLSLAGHGGMGDVYCGVDLRLNRLVAIKILPTYLAGDPLRFKRFEQEARAIAAMNHPHICVLHDAGKDAGTYYIVFEYLVGELLSDRLRREALPLAEALQYLTQIAEALEHAHQQGIVHQDLKPQNIMLTMRGVKLLDFGIAELEVESISHLHPTSGTPAYMAPEQAEGLATDARTDIFAFGRLASEMIPNGAGSHALKSLIAACLARQPDQRWQSISKLLPLLRDFIGKIDGVRGRIQ